MKKVRQLFIFSCILITPLVFAQSALNCDFSNLENKKNKTFNFWDNENKIFSGPINSVSNSKVDNGGRGKNLNYVRTLGGWRKVENGVPAKDFSGDLATFSNGAYVYDASKMINKLKQYITNGVNITQIVLDNPPWVFQRGLNFVEEINNVDYLKSTQIETYGNAIPPNDNTEWRRFIRFVMRALVNEFGLSTVEQWRFRGGSEIETSGHWAGTKEQYFTHYRIIAEEVKRAAPNAKIGVHLREANFASNKINYKGEQVKSFGREFITWTKRNNVPYDFMAVSYYPFFNKLEGGLGGLDVFNFYDVGIKPLAESPDFNTNADVEIHEFWLFTNFGNGLLVNVGTSHGSAFFIKLARLAYERGIKKVNQWGYGEIGKLFSPQRMAMKLLKSVEGQDRYKYRANIVTENSNTIDAIFTANKTENENTYSAIISNYSHLPAYSDNKERVVVNMQLPFDTGQAYEYRITTYGKDQCGFNKLKDISTNYSRTEANGGWLKNGVQATYGHIGKAMAGSGSVRRSRMNTLATDANTLENYNNFTTTDWLSGITKNINNTNTRSRFTAVLNLESFMVQKIEVRLRNMVLSTSSEKPASIHKLLIYPNPANTNVNVTLQGGNKIKTLEINNILGKMVYHKNVNASQIKLPVNKVFKQGLYLVKITDINNYVFYSKLLVE